MKQTILSLIMFALVASCTITKTAVGTYKEETGEEYTYAKARQIHLFWGLVPLGYADAATPADGSCEVITRKNVGDVIITTLTAGIVVTTTIKVKDKRQE